MKKVFVAGSTGHIGSHFITAALAKGFRVTALKTKVSKSHFEKHENLEIVEGSVLNSDMMIDCSKGCDYIFSAIGDEDDYHPHAYAPDFRYMGTANLIQAAQKNKAKKLITMLKASLLKFRDGTRPIDAADPFLYMESLGSDMVEARKMWKTWQLLKESDINWTVFCPVHVVDQDATGDYLIKDDEFVDMLDLERVTMGDLAEAIIKEFLKDEHKGKLIGIRTMAHSSSPNLAL